MGLKYEIFMIKGTADGFYKKLCETIPEMFYETSDLMNREREWHLRPFPNTKDINKLKKALEIPEDLTDYINEGQNRFGIWWMDHPTNDGIVVGGYTTHWLREADFAAIFSEILVKLKIPEFIKVNYHHGSNDGDIYKIAFKDLKKNPEIAKKSGVYKHIKGEDERWEKYATRVEKIAGYPVMEWHEYISDSKMLFVPWTYEIKLKTKQEIS